WPRPRRWQFPVAPHQHRRPIHEPAMATSFRLLLGRSLRHQSAERTCSQTVLPRQPIHLQTTPHADFAMSALDQAIIKAYAKDQLPPADASLAVASPPPRPGRPSRAPVDGYAVEQIYRDGVLYRIETPRNVAVETAAVPVPHLPLLP